MRNKNGEFRNSEFARRRTWQAFDKPGAARPVYHKPCGYSSHTQTSVPRHLLAPDLVDSQFTYPCPSG